MTPTQAEIITFYLRMITAPTHRLDTIGMARVVAQVFDLDAIYVARVLRENSVPFTLAKRPPFPTGEYRKLRPGENPYA